VSKRSSEVLLCRSTACISKSDASKFCLCTMYASDPSRGDAMAVIVCQLGIRSSRGWTESPIESLQKGKLAATNHIRSVSVVVLNMCQCSSYSVAIDKTQSKTWSSYPLNLIGNITELFYHLSRSLW